MKLSEKLDFNILNKHMLSELDELKKTISTKNIVEIDDGILDSKMISIISDNIESYIYDLEKLFLNEFIIQTNRGDTDVKIYFTYKMGKIVVIEEISSSKITEINFGGIAITKDNNFKIIPSCNDNIYNICNTYANFLKEKGTDINREDVATKLVVEALAKIFMINEIITKDKQFVVESTKAIELKSKSNKKKGKNQKTKKKTKLVRYFKIDSNKIKKAKEEEDKLKREYKRYTDEWSKIGHYRTYKNGKKIWIEPTTCKSSKKTGESLSKIYKIIK